MQKSIKVAIIGLGNIAQGYNNPEDKSVLTHIKGYLCNKNFNISYVFDIDKKKSKEVIDKWNLKNTLILDNIEDLKGKKVDVISICSPDSTHYSILISIIKFSPNIVFCEKPISLNLSEAKEIIDLYKNKNIELVINYSRRWLNKIIEIRNDINKKKFGRILSVRMKYYNGFLHNGSHLIDLISMFLNPKIENGIILTEEYYTIDNIISACCNFSSSFGNFNLMIEGYNGQIINPIELEFVFEKHKILIKEENGSKILVYVLVENKIYNGYYEFLEKEVILINESEAMINAIESIYRYCTYKDTKGLKSTSKSALETLNMCNNISLLKRITNV